MAKFEGFAAQFTLEIPKNKRGGGTTNFYSVSQNALKQLRHNPQEVIEKHFILKGLSHKDAAEIADWLYKFFNEVK